MSWNRDGAGPTMTDTGIRHVREFLETFRRAVKEKQLRKLWEVYTEFEKITTNQFKVSSWPNPLTVSSSLELKDSSGDQLFLFLYKELFFRHIFEKVPELITPQHRINSWINYINLFNFFVEEEATWAEHFEQEDDESYSIIALPNMWLWHMISSFVEQFAQFHAWNVEENMKATRPIQIPENSWAARHVLRYLHILCENGHVPIRFAERMDSFIDDTKDDENVAAKAAAVDTDASFLPNTFKMLGQFSLVGLLRVNTLLCDYRTAIECVDPIDLRTKSALTKITPCNVTIHYNLAFCYMMVGRLVDSSRILCSLLARYMRDRSNTVLQSNPVYKKARNLLLITYSISPSKLEDKSIIDPLREQHADSFQIFDASAKANESRGDTGEEDETSMSTAASSSVLDDKRNGEYIRLFKEAAPHFIDVSPWEEFSYDEKDDGEDRNAKLLDEQCQLFVSRVCQSRYKFEKYKKALQYFGAVPVTRLCSVFKDGTQDPSTFSLELLKLKRKMRQIRRFDGAASTGEWYSETDFDFFINEDMVHVRELKVERMGKYTNHFIKNIRQLRELIEADRQADMSQNS